jgi:hypothetical protein
MIDPPDGLSIIRILLKFDSVDWRIISTALSAHPAVGEIGKTLSAPFAQALLHPKPEIQKPTRVGIVD